MKRVAAIDIGSYSIKLIELQEHRGQLEVLRYGTSLVLKDDIKSSLRDLVSTAKLSLKRVNVSLSGPAVIVRYIEMPPMKKEELISAIKFEAEKYVPFDISDAIIDCAMLDKSPSGGQRVLLAAAKKDKVNNYIEIFKEIGLDIDIIDVDSFAFLNAFQRIKTENKEETTAAIINIGAKFSNMNIITKGQAYFTRDILLGGADITNRIKDFNGISLEEAELLKCKPGEKKDEISRIISPILEKLVSEIRMSFDYFETQFGKNIETLYISGGSSRLFNIMEFLKDNLGVETRRWDPFEGIKLQQPMLDIEKNAPAQFAVAIGLAFRK
jgi:type IV pilus assembly protein PilM